MRLPYGACAQHATWFASLFLWACCALLSPLPAAAAQDDYLDPSEAFRGSARLLGPNALEVHLDIAPAYHLYRDRIAVEVDGEGAELGALAIPHGRAVFDEAAQRELEVLQGDMRVRVPVAMKAGQARLRLSYQGCADKGLCYPPQTAFMALQADANGLTQVSWQAEDTAPIPAAAPSPVVSGPPATAVDNALRSGKLLTIVGVFLLAGLLLSFTPCVLPMVPILSSIIVGQGAPVSRGHGFAMALAYSLGMALVYTGFGVIAGLLGEGLAAALQNAWVLGGFALVLATLALSMFGVFDLQMPAAIQSRLAETSGRLPGGRFAGVFLMGGVSALIVGPCVAAPLAGALVFISQTRDVALGGLALFSLAMGMSVPLLLVGLSAGSLLPRAGAWMEGVKRFFGVLLLGVALWIVSPVLPGGVLMLILGAALLVGAAALELFDPLTQPALGRDRLARGVALVLAVLGTTQLVGAVSGGDTPLQPLRHLARGGVDSPTARQADFRRVRSLEELDDALRTAGRPVMLDFYADWCASCKEMQHLTFDDAAVRRRLSNALLLQADVTADSEQDKALLKRFGLFGPPGIVFFDAKGREQPAARVIGFVPPQQFAQSLAASGL